MEIKTPNDGRNDEDVNLVGEDEFFESLRRIALRRTDKMTELERQCEAMMQSLRDVYALQAESAALVTAHFNESIPSRGVVPLEFILLLWKHLPREAITILHKVSVAGGEPDAADFNVGEVELWRRDRDASDNGKATSETAAVHPGGTAG